MRLPVQLFFAGLAAVHSAASASEFFTGIEGGVRYQVVPYIGLRMSGIVVQQVDSSCGSASMAMLLAEKFGIEIPEQVLFDIVVAPLSKDPTALKAIEQNGLSITHLAQMVAPIDLHVQGVTRTLEGVLSSEALPVLARIAEPNRQNTAEVIEHWVVVRAVHGNRVLVRDPVIGNRRMPIHAFANAWVGKSGKGVLVRVTRDAAGKAAPASQARTEDHEVPSESPMPTENTAVNQ